MKANRLLFPCIAGLYLGACGGGQPADDPSGVDSETAAVSEAEDGSSDSAAEETPAWSEMNKDQKMEFMGLVILPEMKKVFQEADPESYAEFKCQTCHGDDGKDVGFEMPNGLFALEKPDPIPASEEYDAETTKFMMEKVVPKMAELMGMEPGKEFGCFNCHEAEE